MIGGSNALMSAEECAHYLNVSVKTLLRNRDEWGLKSIKVGRSVKFRVRDVDSWIAGHEDA